MDPLWKPSNSNDSALYKFTKSVNSKFNVNLSSYEELWQWSTENLEQFWRYWWIQSNIVTSKDPIETLISADSFEKEEWFPDAKLNFAENLLRYKDAETAIIFRNENGSREIITYEQLFQIAGTVAAGLKKLGVKKGDRIAAVMPNCPETIIAMLATTWLGAIWSSCSPDFGKEGILERFEQIKPRVLIAIDGYQFKGKKISICEKVGSIAEKLACDCVLVNWQQCGNVKSSISWESLLKTADDSPDFYQMRFNDPVYILYSSGTTGKPKCIVHGIGGTLLQHLKEHRLHTDITRNDTLFYFTTCGWMMWNWLVSGLASGCTILLFDGNPFYPKYDALMRIANEEGVSVFGTSAKYLSALGKENAKPNLQYDFKKLRTILSTGSPLTPESYDYVYQNIKNTIQLSSISGGTDIVSCFALGSPTLPVYRGELQCRGLGMAVEIWDNQGKSVRNQSGELVCTKSFPSKPVFFWNDPKGERYHHAYFSRFDNVWCHGDWAELTENNGLIITGRSDAVLNPGGVRIGTAEIYREVEKIPSVIESIAVGQSWEGDVRVVLFVVLRQDEELTELIKTDIRHALKTNASPRHVPAKIIKVTDIPRTRSGKITEIAVRDIIHNRQILNAEAISNPEALNEFKNRTELLN